jgi:putative chitinase
MGVDFVRMPELLEQDVNAARSAAWWWANNGCNELADAGDVRALSRRINLGNAKSTRTPNGMADRQKRYDRARLFL